MQRATERGRMLSGAPYRASDPELVLERARARELTARYNAAPQADESQRRSLLGELLARVGEGAGIEPPFYCDYGWNISLGAGAFLNFNCVLLDCAAIEIGPLTKIGPAVQLCAATHPVAPAERETGLEFALPISIGRNVWIGAGAIIGPGVTIGDDSIVGAGSVVLREVPAGVVAVGNPCRVLRTLES